MFSTAPRKEMLKTLDAYFSVHGFKRKSDRFYGDRYDRPISGGRQSIAINYHLRKPALVLDPAYASVHLDEIEAEVFRFEEKNELVSEHDALQRNTIGVRVGGKHYDLIEEDDCASLCRRYADETFSDATAFWGTVATPEMILEKLSDVSGRAREYAGTEVIAATRGVVLTKCLLGRQAAESFSERVLGRMSESSKREFSKWAMRAFAEWRGIEGTLATAAQ